jgi:hypothetical protein
MCRTESAIYTASTPHSAIQAHVLDFPDDKKLLSVISNESKVSAYAKWVEKASEIISRYQVSYANTFYKEHVPDIKISIITGYPEF